MDKQLLFGNGKKLLKLEVEGHQFLKEYSCCEAGNECYLVVEMDKAFMCSWDGQDEQGWGITQLCLLSGDWDPPVLGAQGIIPVLAVSRPFELLTCLNIVSNLG